MRIPKWLKWTLGIIVGIAVAIAAALFIMNEPMPKGKTGPEAEALANKVLNAIDKTAWDSTNVIQWTFAGQHTFLWDKKRHLTEVTWGDNRALIDLKTVEGKAWKNGKALEGKAAEKLVKKAWSFWCNDSFWLNAPAKLFDGGTERSIVKTEDGDDALMITYKGGGVTPGDSYLWFLDDNGLPTHYKMWVKIIPTGGVQASWEAWETLPTGAKIATKHNIAGMEIAITNLKAAKDLPTFGATDDPFAPLFP